MGTRSLRKLLVALTVAVTLAGATLLAPAAARASAGCDAFNSPEADFFTPGASAGPFAFAAGDTLTFAASPPTGATLPTGIELIVTIGVSSTTLTAPFPGTLQYTIPTSGMYVLEWRTTNGAGATWTVSCTPALAVGVRSLAASWDAGGVVVRWRTASILGTLGFNVYREVNGERVRVNARLIAPRASGAYLFRDRRAPRARVVRYWLQEVGLDGSRGWYGPAVVRQHNRGS